jgi:hypothetical protein
MELSKRITPLKQRKLEMSLFVAAASVVGVGISPMRQIMFWLSPYINFLVIF